MEEDGGGIGGDWGVGMIVWVRRRNGSWWPGRVLGNHEVPASHLLSPRSGMPVQLLGREDGSVDWYNLEKSIRVKTFRCGEFDDCIQKAEASHGAPIKKREKYARREDAIRHALELEKKQLEMIQDKSGLPASRSTSRPTNALKRESELSTSDMSEKIEMTTVHTKFLEHKSHSVSKKTSLPCEEKNLVVNSRKSGKQIRPEHNIPEAVPVRGGMRDFVHSTATNKQSWHYVQGNASKGKGVLISRREKSHGGSDLGHSYSSHSEGNPFVTSAARETQNIGIPFQTEGSKLFSFPVYTNDTHGNDGYASEETSSEFEMDSPNCIKPLPEDYTFSDSSENNELETTRTEYMKIKMDENTNPLGEQYGIVDNNEVSLSSFGVKLQKHGHEHEHPTDASADGRVKWHMKGKRKARSISKNTFDVMNIKTSICGSGKFNESSRMPFHGQKQVNFSSQDLHMIDEDLRQEQVGRYSSWGHPSALKSATLFHRISQPAWEVDEPSHWNQGAYMEESDECYGPVYHACQSKEVPSTLVDVDLQVKASYQGEHVPLVSLMSRLNGKAIIGHPVQVEILEDGSTSQYFCSTDADSDEATATLPAQRIDRQPYITCVPRSNAVNSDFKDAQERKRTSNRIMGHDIQKARLPKYSFHAEQLSPGKFQKNLKRHGLCSKNARRPHSSHAILRKCSGKKKYAKARRDDDFLSGLIKPEGSLPLVTCVPVKVAFSRIMEAVGRPSTLSHRVRMTSVVALRDLS